VNGTKKTWTGPKWAKDSSTAQAGGFTEWTRDPNGKGTLKKYTCQTVTTSEALGEHNVQVYLWNTTAKTADLW